MRIAVVIPCRNEVKHIEECVRAIYASIVPSEYEISVYVIDGKSDDGTLDLIDKLKTSFSSLHCISNERQLTPFAFNLGIEADKEADYVQIVGARQIIDKDYLAKAVEVLEKDPSIWCLGGRVKNEYLNETGEVIAEVMSTSLGMGLGNFRTLESSGFVDTVGTPMYPYRVFDKIGLFDEELIRNQDDDFNFRVTKAGGKVYYEHGISLKYYVRGNFKGLWRQFFQYGYWKVYVNKKHKAVTTWRQLVPPLFVLYVCSLIIVGLSLPLFFSALYSVPLILYCGLVATAMFKLLGKGFDANKVSLTYLILHFSYGFGYLKGVFHFLLLGKKPSEKEKRLSR